MLRKILVPLDGSASALWALQVAACLARGNGASLVLVRVVPGPSGAAVSATAGDLWAPAAVPTERMAALDYLGDLAAVQQLVGIDVQMLTPAGAAAPTIVASARACAADLIVLCRSSHHGPAYWMCGDVAREVVRLARVPVLVLRSDDEDTSAALLRGRDSRLAVVALDGSSAAAAALVPAAELVSGLSALVPGALHLVRVVAQPAGIAPARSELRAHAERLMARYPRLAVTWSVEMDGDVAQRLTWVAQYGPDAEEACTHPGVLRGWVAHDTASPPAACAPPALIALASYGAHGPRRGAPGDTVEELLHSAPLPLLIVPPAGPVASASRPVLVRASTRRRLPAPFRLRRVTRPRGHARQSSRARARNQR